MQGVRVFDNVIGRFVLHKRETMEGDAVMELGTAGGRELELLVDLCDLDFVGHRRQVANDLLKFRGWHADDGLKIQQVGHFVRVGIEVQ